MSTTYYTAPPDDNVTPETLERLVSHLQQAILAEPEETARHQAAETLAIVRLLHDALLRPGVIADLTIADVSLAHAVVYAPHPKRRYPNGPDPLVSLTMAAVQDLDRWITLRGRDNGPLFACGVTGASQRTRWIINRVRDAAAQVCLVIRSAHDIRRAGRRIRRAARKSAMGAVGRGGR